MKYFLAGGAGFIGSELAHRLLEKEPDCEIVIYDKLVHGKDLILDLFKNPRSSFWCCDIKDLDQLTEAMKGCDVVFHFASNADIAKAMLDPTIDFYEGTLLTQNILEAMRINGIKKIVYASGSGVYGTTGLYVVSEEDSFHPISPYGASKMAGEGLISAYCHLFDMQGSIYRFANVIGKNSTHGVILDFIYKLKSNTKELRILGSGRQEKGYMHINDILNGIFVTCFKHSIPCNAFNLAPDDLITVTEIANMVVEEMGLTNVKYIYGDTFGGWIGDVPQIIMSSEKARIYGWKPKYTTIEAVKKSIREMLGKE